ncbi:MAG: septum formation inhibitor Maf [Firmicutes bacterium]|nr:septum formation inhibitor Maf [Bacillota bacterium]
MSNILKDNLQEAHRVGFHSADQGNLGFVLASASPARAALLKQIGLKFEIVPSRIREDDITGDCPVDKVMYLSKAKAGYVSELLTNKVVIAADTVVVLNNKILGKPEDKNMAEDMLSLLSGCRHQVITGLTVVNTRTGESSTSHEITEVQMEELSPESISAYVGSGEPLGKAGAYAIQGKGGIFIKSIKGCYFNVVGLPLAKLADTLKNIGINVYDEIFRR